MTANQETPSLNGVFCSYRGPYGRCQKPADTTAGLVPWCWDHLAVTTAIRRWNGRLKREGLGVLPPGRTAKQRRQATKGGRRSPR